MKTPRSISLMTVLWLTTSGTALTSCVPAEQNYLYGPGYVLMTRKIAEALKADFPTLSLSTPADDNRPAR